MIRAILLSIQRLVLVLLAVAAGAASAQRATFDGGTGLLTLPAVRVGAATYVNVVLGLIDPATFTFRLQTATLQTPAGAADVVFDAASGGLTIPDVAVGSANYSARLQLTDLATYTFVLASAEIKPAASTLAQIQALVFTPMCSGCHDGSSGAILPGALNLTTGNSYANLVNVSAREAALMRVAPGDPDNSYLYRKLLGSGITGQRMPFGGPYLDDATMARIRSWIASGAPNN
ncbi:MAG: hypothetical protein JNN18_09770 [Rubrivivax sp.]|nr:hypothetical protein [Rubrivivax sp.]